MYDFSYMMSCASSHLSQLVLGPQLGIELVALSLSAVILPVWCKGVREGIGELFHQGLVGAQARKLGSGGVAPKDAAVLLAGATDTPDPVEGSLSFAQAVQHQVYRLEPHGYRGKDLALIAVDEDAFGERVLGAEVGVKVNLGLGYN